MAQSGLTYTTNGVIFPAMEHIDLIQQLGGPSRVAAAFALPERRVRGWRDRNRIPAQYWRRFVGQQLPSGLTVTYELLAEAA